MARRNKTKENQMIYFFLGIFLTGMGIYLNYQDLFNGEFPNSIMLLALGLSQLMFAYLSPHLFPNDERSKEIKGKAMMVNYFVLFGTMLILFRLTGPLGSLTLDSTQVLAVLFSIMVLTIPGTMIVYSKLI
ncbi:hypothetical protein ACFYKT_21880 [Cytobacillus sp. FJAT-53684]|uniref:Permease n=1 Tax=Cytobacillus mangrovibacter TaxID=3299024 RepID=A0ABW6K862_9BACI